MRRELTGPESMTIVHLSMIRKGRALAVEACQAKVVEIEEQISKTVKELGDKAAAVMAEEEKHREEAIAFTAQMLGYLNDGADIQIPADVLENLSDHVSGEPGAMVLEWGDPAPAKPEPAPAKVAKKKRKRSA